MPHKSNIGFFCWVVSAALRQEYEIHSTLVAHIQKLTYIIYLTLIFNYHFQHSSKICRIYRSCTCTMMYTNKVLLLVYHIMKLSHRTCVMAKSLVFQWFRLFCAVGHPLMLSDDSYRLPRTDLIYLYCVLTDPSVLWCESCRSHVPATSAHCPVCEICVLGRDHHCIWWVILYIYKLSNVLHTAMWFLTKWLHHLLLQWKSFPPPPPWIRTKMYWSTSWTPSCVNPARQMRLQ